MATSIPNLWPDEISVDILTPQAILRAQASTLKRITKGLLEAEVRIDQITDESADGTTTTLIHFDLFAPALNRSSYRLLTASHSGDMVYPIRIKSAYFDPVDFMLGLAFSEKTFTDAIKNLFASSQTKSLMQSLIARSNEQLAADRPAASEDEISSDDDA